MLSHTKPFSTQLYKPPLSGKYNSSKQFWLKSKSQESGRHIRSLKRGLSGNQSGQLTTHEDRFKRDNSDERLTKMQYGTRNFERQLYESEEAQIDQFMMGGGQSDVSGPRRVRLIGESNFGKKDMHQYAEIIKDNKMSRHYRNKSYGMIQFSTTKK